MKNGKNENFVFVKTEIRSYSEIVIVNEWTVIVYETVQLRKWVFWLWTFINLLHFEQKKVMRIFWTRNEKGKKITVFVLSGWSTSIHGDTSNCAVKQQEMKFSPQKLFVIDIAQAYTCDLILNSDENLELEIFNFFFLFFQALDCHSGLLLYNVFPILISDLTPMLDPGVRTNQSKSHSCF